MRHVPRRLALLAVLLAVLGAASPSGGGSRFGSGPEGGGGPPGRQDIGFARRWTADLHGGLIRIGNSAVTCDEKRDQYRIEGAAPCVTARGATGQGIYNNNYQMIQRPQTSATLALPAGSRVAYARLYWGGTNGMDSPNGPRTLDDRLISHVTLTSPGGRPAAVTADAPLGRARGEVEYAYQTSADVTGLVTAAGAGTYRLSGLGLVATPYSYGGWTLIVAYENPAEPLRRLTLYDGYRTIDPGVPFTVALDGLKNPASEWPKGRLGYVTYDGDRTLTGDQASVRAPHGMRIRLTDQADPYDDIMNSTADGFARDPADRNTFGWDADEFDVTNALWPGDSSLGLTFTTTENGDGYQVGAVYTQVQL